MQSKYTVAARAYHYLYDSAQWKRLRKQHLNNHPLCVMCIQQGTTRAASVCDHINPHKGNISLFFNSNNLQSLCKTHHDSAKQKQERKGIEPGADVNGYPIDKQHHWYK